MLALDTLGKGIPLFLPLIICKLSIDIVFNSFFDCKLSIDIVFNSFGSQCRMPIDLTLHVMNLLL